MHTIVLLSVLIANVVGHINFDDSLSDEYGDRPPINLTPPPSLNCRHPEKQADICGDEVQETCDHGALHDERCTYMRRVCVCKRGYVRPDDFNNYAPKGQCIPFDQCSDGMDKKKLKFFLPVET